MYEMLEYQVKLGIDILFLSTCIDVYYYYHHHYSYFCGKNGYKRMPKAIGYLDDRYKFQPRWIGTYGLSIYIYLYLYLSQNQTIVIYLEGHNLISLSRFSYPHRYSSSYTLGKDGRRSPSSHCRATCERNPKESVKFPLNVG